MQKEIEAADEELRASQHQLLRDCHALSLREERLAAREDALEHGFADQESNMEAITLHLASEQARLNNAAESMVRIFWLPFP